MPLETMRGNGASEEVLDYVKAVLSDQFQRRWSELAAGGAFAAEEARPMMAIYDRDDPRVRHGDGEALAGVWPGTRVIKTDGYGHNRILQAEETLDALRRFVEV